MFGRAGKFVLFTLFEWEFRRKAISFPPAVKDSNKQVFVLILQYVAVLKVPFCFENLESFDFISPAELPIG